jgi:hypothetical protein
MREDREEEREREKEKTRVGRAWVMSIIKMV